MSGADEDKLGKLHETLAETYLAEIQRLKEVGDPIPPALLTSAAKFLKDNGIDRPARAGDPEDKLAGVLNEEFGSREESFSTH